MVKIILLCFSLLSTFTYNMLASSDIPHNVQFSDCVTVAILSLISILIVFLGKKTFKLGTPILCIIFDILWIESIFSSIKNIYYPKTFLLVMNIIGFGGVMICTILSLYKIYKSYKNKTRCSV